MSNIVINNGDKYRGDKITLKDLFGVDRNNKELLKIIRESYNDTSK